MKLMRGMWLVAALGSILLGAAGGYAQTKPTSITVSPTNPFLKIGQTLQFTAHSGNTLDFGESSAIATGHYHTCALLANGTVKCWGYNQYGQLGDGSRTDSLIPVAVKNLSGVVAISAGQYHTCALLANGRVKCWGDNTHGQLGDGTTAHDTLTAVTVLTDPSTGAFLSGAVSIAAGGNHTCALLLGGTVKCWGNNDYGQLGDGSKTESPTPVTVSGLSGAVAITAGFGHACALLAGGTAKCWGWNIGGQLGDGTKKDRTSPVAVSGLSGEVAIAAGPFHTCALLSGGTVKCWGMNSHGELGDGSNADSLTPVAVTGLSGAVAITAGHYHTCALLSDGTTKCWGLGSDGQLGDGSKTDRTSPVAVSGLSGAVAISAGAYHTCALLSDGTTKCWGSNQNGELGDGTRADSSLPVTVTGEDQLPGSGAIDVTASGGHTCALLADGTAKCWGDNSFGGLGDGTEDFRLSPVPVRNLSGAVATSVGRWHSCAVLSNGTAKCWGSNSYGQLGDGSRTDRLTPVTVVADPGSSSALPDVVAITAGLGHTCALQSYGDVWCWGDNEYGQLGAAAGSTSSTPMPVRDVAGAVAIAAGLDHTCALLSNGTVKCWGRNNYGQLGDGTFTSTNQTLTPVAVKNLSGVVAISAGQYHTCALLANGAAKCWGYNYYGQLGDGSRTDRLTPVAVQNLGGAAAISAGGFHTCALLVDGTAKCWGNNSYGQLGDGSLSPEWSTTPVAVKNLSSAVAVSAGPYTTCALLSNGTVNCWGHWSTLGNGVQIANAIEGTTPVPTVSLVPLLKWASDNKGVATIDANTGLATGVSSGWAGITATYGTLSAKSILGVY